MVDFFCVLMLPGAGDELQGIKNGMLEIADALAINKADGENVAPAQQAASQYIAALHILTPRSPTWAPPVIDLLGTHRRRHRGRCGSKCWRIASSSPPRANSRARRREQQVKWMWAMLEDRIHLRLKTDAKLKARLPAIEKAVADGRISPAVAAEEVAPGAGSCEAHAPIGPRHRLRPVPGRAFQSAPRRWCKNSARRRRPAFADALAPCTCSRPARRQSIANCRS